MSRLIGRRSEPFHYSVVVGMRYVAEMKALRLLDEVEPAGIAAQSV